MFAMEADLAHNEICRVCLVYILHPELSLGQIDHSKIKQYQFAIDAAQCWYGHDIPAF